MAAILPHRNTLPHRGNNQQSAQGNPMTGNHRRGLTARRRAVLDRSTTSRIRNATLTLATVLTLVVGSVLMSGTAPAAQTGGSGGAFTDRTFQPFTASNG